jgi:hypothetical protein
MPKSRSGLRSPISNEYIRSYYTEVARQSPSFAALNDEVKGKVVAAASDYWIARIRKVRIFLIGFTPYYIAWYYVIFKHPGNQLYALIGSIPIIAAMITLSFQLVRFNNEGLAATRLLRTIAVLEHNISRWPTSEFRWDIARRLEYIAKSVERIPLGLRSVAPDVRRQASETSKAKAQAIRELELSAIQPGPSTFSNLVHQLCEDMVTITDGRWYELPEAVPSERHSPWWMRVAAMIGSILIAAGGIAVLTYSAKIGPASAVLAPILFAGSLVLLSTAGIPSRIVEGFSGMTGKLSSN